MDLNGDCQWMIIKEMDMDDLPAVAEAHDHIAYAVADVLRRKFATKMIVIGEAGYYQNFGNAVNMEEFDDRIELRRHSAVPKILKNFGHLISKLMVLHEFTIPDDVAQSIYSAINLYCSDSLTELQIFNQNYVFAEFKKPFKNVEFVLLGGFFDDLNNSNMTFAELFPAMRQLSTIKFYSIDANLFAHHFPHLTTLTDEKQKWGDDKFHQYDSLINLIKLNPQIQNLTLRCAIPKLLQVVNDKLPQLQHLGLNFYRDIDSDEYNINFEHVKSILVKASDLISAERFTFPNLEQIEFVDISYESHQWSEIIKNTPSLRRIQISNTYSLDAMRAAIMMENGFKMTKMHFQNGDEVLVINLNDQMENIENSIQGQLTNDWQCIRYIFTKI